MHTQNVSRGWKRLRLLWHLAAELGIRNVIALLLANTRSRACGRTLYRFSSRHLMHPVELRHPSSDWSVFRQVVLERQYACLDDVASPDLIIDCGAYAGYSSAYFLSRFPACRVIAVEPDPGNFALLQRNLAPFRDRADAVQGAVWSGAAQLRMSGQPFRDGREWARRVETCEPGEQGTVRAVDIASLLSESGGERISLLKVDVEGAETIVFGASSRDWISYVDNIVIELHDDSAFGDPEEAFFGTIAPAEWEITRSGELTVCRRRARPSAA